MCDRNKNGGEVNPYLTNASISFEQFKQLFPVEFIQQLRTFYMCGNHGDPILNTEVLQMFQYLREHNSALDLSMTTNGGAQKPEWWEELGRIRDLRVNFSIDGLEDTNHLYRQGVVWKRVEENLDAFVSAGGRADWTFLVFNYNEHQVEEAQQFSQLMGVKNFIVKKSGRYLTANHERKTEHQAVFRKGLGELLAEPKNEKYRNNALKKAVDIITIIQEEKVVPKCVQKKEIYVSAEGFVFPCCWTHGQMYKWYLEPEEAQIWENIKAHNINALNTSIEEVVNGGFFESIEKRWEGENRLDVCVLKCNKKFDPFTAQWK